MKSSRLIYRSFTITLFILLYSVYTYAQDLHFSQYYNAPLLINPALTGVHQADIRWIGNYRSQWSSVPVPYKTVAAMMDMKFQLPKFSNGYFAGALLFDHDRAGDVDLSWDQINLYGSYTHYLSDQWFLTSGFQIGFGQRSFDQQKLKTENQWNGDIFDPTLPAEQFDQAAVGFIDLSAGINLQYQGEDGRNWVNIGLGLFHLNQADQNFQNDAIEKRPIRVATYAFGGLKINRQFHWVLHGMGQWQKEQAELLLGTGAKYFLNADKGKEMAIQFTSALRFADQVDAIIPAVEFQYLSWKLGFSYDINISDFSVATNRAGGPELAVIYTITKVKPLGVFKACPIF